MGQTTDFRNIFQNYEMLFITDENYNFLYVSKVFAGLLKYDKNEFSGKNLKYFLGDDGKILLKNVTDALFTENSWEGNVIFTLKSGNLAELHMSIASDGFNTENSAFYFTCSKAKLKSEIPILPEKKVENRKIRSEAAELKNSLENLLEKINLISAILDTIDDLVVILDKNGKIIKFNKYSQLLTGYTFEEVEGKPFWDLCESEEDKLFIQNLLATEELKTIQSDMQSCWCIDKSGHKKFIEWTYKGIHDKNGDINYLMAKGVDRTHMKEREANLSSLFNSTSDHIFSIDHNLQITEFNNAFSQFLEKETNIKVAKGLPLQDIISTHRYPISTKHFITALGGDTVKDIFEFTDSLESIHYMSVIYTPILSEYNTRIGSMAICRDITENKIAETQLLEINKQIAEYKLMALRSVMNPHFLFNSLNSIQYFIAKSERKLALNYLSIFSSLIRKILDSSVNHRISLSTEIEILNYYISLEMMRFENKFDYKINIDPEVDAESIEIPSLLIQPYVENAIVHGLLNKEGAGSLKIDITPEAEGIQFIVEDNGVGREEARTIKNKNPKNNKSYGMLVTKERLDIINKTDDVSVAIEDLKDKKNMPCGTRVKISLRI